MRFSLITMLTAIAAVQAVAVPQSTDGQACTGFLNQQEREGTCDRGRCGIFTPPNEVALVQPSSGNC